MTDIEKMVAQLDELIRQYEEFIRGPRTEGADGSNQARVLVSRLESAIDRLALPNSSYVKQLDLHRSEKRTRFKIHDVYSIALGLRDDLKEGWIAAAIEIVHANTHSDYLEMSEALIRSGYKDAAAVIAGTALEVHVRALCMKHGVDTKLSDGAPKRQPP
ncbi:hypothetical protein [Streptomyces olivaceus]|uniref:hypothetical protein n=1 Tax=Streptomyces olivaceus TaxID=47716 RepID=UPI0036E86D87